MFSAHPDRKPFLRMIELQSTLEVPLLEVEDEESPCLDGDVASTLEPPPSTRPQRSHEGLSTSGSARAGGVD